MAATNIPWTQILALLPDVARAARGISRQWKTAPTQAPVDPSASLAAQLAAAVERIEMLEANEKAQSEVVDRIVGQLQGLADGLQETAARQRLVLRVSVAALVLAASALGVAILA